MLKEDSSARYAKNRHFWCALFAIYLFAENTAWLSHMLESKYILGFVKTVMNVGMSWKTSTVP